MANKTQRKVNTMLRKINKEYAQDWLCQWFSVSQKDNAFTRHECYPEHFLVRITDSRDENYEERWFDVYEVYGMKLFMFVNDFVIRQNNLYKDFVEVERLKYLETR